MLALAGLLYPSTGVAQAATADPARAQAQVVSRAITETCGSLPDPKAEAVVAGIVLDSISGVVLPGAQVKLSWHRTGDRKPTSHTATTDGGGFFAFCEVPGGVTASLTAHLRVTRGPTTLEVEPGQLYVQHVLLPLSTTTEPGILVGRVVDAQTRDPLAGVTVRLVERNQATATNDRGYFSFGSQPFGVYMLDVKAMGYAPRKAPVRVAGDFTQDAEIELSQKAVELEGLNVLVRPKNQRFDLDGLVRRMNVGVGNFVTRDQLEKRPRARITEFLRETPGVRVNVSRDRSYTLEVRGRPCLPDVFVDGVYYHASDNALDLPAASDLEAVEIYRGAAEIPGIYLRPSPTRPPCAVIAAWTRVHPGAGKGSSGRRIAGR
ncbi:MAG: carboxypeptidase regulatory-like domain-containing protein [Gemmatimonadetes bacterium]|nr:carboxypeptidase regulatory-like domain-containing protein [Gemmatimonadota bacterium]